MMTDRHIEDSFIPTSVDNGVSHDSIISGVNLNLGGVANDVFRQSNDPLERIANMIYESNKSKEKDSYTTSLEREVNDNLESISNVFSDDVSYY